jgi:hypothetical protein
MKAIFFILTVIFLVGCSASDKKLFIKSVQVSEEKRVDWYFYSLISNFSRSYLQYEDKEAGQHTFFESFYLSDFSKIGDTLTIQGYKNDYKLDKDNAATLALVVRIDTTGGIWNQASSRLGRLQRKNVNFEQFHYADSYCPKNECY